MTETLMRLAVYDLKPGRTVVSTSASSAYFVCHAGGQISADGSRIEIPANVNATVELGLEARGWLFEAALADAPAPDAVHVLSHIVEPDGRSLVRLDHVAAASGSKTPPHRHLGPGIRRLASGNVVATIGTACHQVTAGEAWFESGEETVVGQNTGELATAFYRLLLLPSTLTGGESSFVSTTQDPKAKRNSSVTVYAEKNLSY